MEQDQINHWINIVNEAYEGSVTIDNTLTKGDQLYNREMANFKLPKDYGEIKTIADLLQSLDHAVAKAVQRVEDPAAQIILSRIKNVIHPERLAMELDKTAKLPNPTKKP